MKYKFFIHALFGLFQEGNTTSRLFRVIHFEDVVEFTEEELQRSKFQALLSQKQEELYERFRTRGDGCSYAHKCLVISTSIVRL